MRRVVVLGAGLTGLSTAYHLARRDVEPVVLEREAEVGGVCRTVSRDGFAFDCTGHLLHLAREESHELLRALGVHHQLKAHKRRAGVALAGTVTPYPIQIHTHRLPAEVRRDCVLGFVEATREAEPDGEKSFADWVLGRFGEGFARHFFFPYNEKLYCTAAEELTTEWVGRYVPRPSLADVIDGAFGLYRAPVGYNARFYYPRQGGIRLLADALAARCGAVRTGCAVRELCLDRRELLLENGERLGWDALIATAPLVHLAALTGDLPAIAVAAAARLRSVRVWNWNLGVRGRAPRREHWLYVPEPRFPFYRVGIPSNHGQLAPANFHTLSIEVSVASGAALSAAVREQCLAGLEELGLLHERGAIVTEQVLDVDPAYVVYDRQRPEAVAVLRDAYRAAGVTLAGRWAEWNYSTMEDALWDGETAARRVT